MRARVGPFSFQGTSFAFSPLCLCSSPSLSLSPSQGFSLSPSGCDLFFLTSLLSPSFSWSVSLLCACPSWGGDWLCPRCPSCPPLYLVRGPRYFTCFLIHGKPGPYLGMKQGQRHPTRAKNPGHPGEVAEAWRDPPSLGTKYTCWVALGQVLLL